MTAEARLAGAISDVAAATAERDRLGEIAVLAGRWADLVAERVKAVEERDAASRLLADSGAIRSDRSRLQELDGVLPALNAAIGRREKIAQAVSAIEGEARSSGSELERKLAEITRLAAENRRALQGVSEEIERDEERRRAIADSLVTLSAPIQRASLARSQREAVEALDRSLAEFPTDLEGNVARLDDDHRRRAEWRAAWPSLQDLRRRAAALAEAHSRGAAAARGSTGRGRGATGRRPPR